MIYYKYEKVTTTSTTAKPASGFFCGGYGVVVTQLTVTE